jgi:hypothetical protein
MEQTPRRHRVRRRLAVAGSAALLTAAGAGGVIALRSHTVQAASVSAPAAAPAAAELADTSTTPVTDTDNVQQGDQSGAQDTTGAADAAKSTGAAPATGSEPAGTEPDAAGGHTDPAGSAGQDGNFNN